MVLMITYENCFYFQAYSYFFVIRSNMFTLLLVGTNWWKDNIINYNIGNCLYSQTYSYLFVIQSNMFTLLIVGTKSCKDRIRHYNIDDTMNIVFIPKSIHICLLYNLTCWRCYLSKQTDGKTISQVVITAQI